METVGVGAGCVGAAASKVWCGAAAGTWGTATYMGSLLLLLMLAHCSRRATADVRRLLLLLLLLAHCSRRATADVRRLLLLLLLLLAHRQKGVGAAQREMLYECGNSNPYYIYAFTPICAVACAVCELPLFKQLCLSCVFCVCVCVCVHVCVCVCACVCE